MLKLNNKGFAVSIILYAAIAIIAVVLLLVLAVISASSNSEDDLVNKVKEEASGIR